MLQHLTDQAQISVRNIFGDHVDAPKVNVIRGETSTVHLNERLHDIDAGVVDRLLRDPPPYPEVSTPEIDHAPHPLLPDEVVDTSRVGCCRRFRGSRSGTKRIIL